MFKEWVCYIDLMCCYIVDCVEDLVVIVSDSNGKICIDVLVMEVLFCVLVCNWYVKNVGKVFGL